MSKDQIVKAMKEEVRAKVIEKLGITDPTNELFI